MHCRIASRLFGLLALATAFAGQAIADSAKDPSGEPRKTVAVDTFLAAESVGGAVTADGMTAMLTNALVKDGRFVVVERPGVASVQAEQALGSSGATTAETAPAAKQMLGANIIIRGTVTRFEASADGASVQAGGFPLSGLFASTAGAKGQRAVLEISLRLIDAVTGQVISTSTAQGSAVAVDANATVTSTKTGAVASADVFHNTPIGEAGEDAIDKAVAEIADGAKNVPWSALVIDDEAGKVYVNAGAERNVQAGLVLTVYRKGKVFTDPATGEVLDVDMEKIGTVKIDSVRAKLSTAVVVDGNPPLRGDVLRLQPRAA